MQVTDVLLALWLVTLAFGHALNFSILDRGNSSAKASIADVQRPLNVKLAGGTGVQIASSWDPHDVATEADAEPYRAKGSWLGCLLEMTDEEAGKAWGKGKAPNTARGLWSGTLENELHTWGWREGSYLQEMNVVFIDGDPDVAFHIGVAVQSLGLSHLPQTMGGNNVGYSIEHFDESKVDEHDIEIPAYDQKYRVGTVQYSCTGAAVRFVVNRVEGAIFAQMLESPRFAAGNSWPYDPFEVQLPILRYSSDIMMAYWLRNNPNPKNLRYYFALNVQEDSTRLLIAKVLQDKGHAELSIWPGLKVSKGSREFDILLGSKLGATIGFMLLQYKSDLGIKHVTDITMFRDTPLEWDTRPEVEMLFTIADVPPTKTEVPAAKDDKSLVHRAVRVERGGRDILRVHEFRTSRAAMVRV